MQIFSKQFADHTEWDYHVQALQIHDVLSFVLRGNLINIVQTDCELWKLDLKIMY